MARPTLAGGASWRRSSEFAVQRLTTVVNVIHADQVRVAVLDALKDLFDLDESLGHANERAVVTRLAVHLERHVGGLGDATLTVDNEYSRVGSRGLAKHLDGRQLFPDLLVHERANRLRNLLVIEVKRRDAVPRAMRGEPDPLDERKVKALVKSRSLLTDSRGRSFAPYWLGACLTVHVPDKAAKLWWWRNDHEGGPFTEEWEPPPYDPPESDWLFGSAWV